MRSQKTSHSSFDDAFLWLLEKINFMGNLFLTNYCLNMSRAFLYFDSNNREKMNTINKSAVLTWNRKLFTVWVSNTLEMDFMSIGK
jgi:hypothetical protein